jgi:hypothetical protein
MPIEWAIAFLSTIVAAVYFSFQSGMKTGIHAATWATIYRLEDEGLIIFEEDGTIKAGKGQYNFAEDLFDEQDEQ